jgi:hypothetical protein
MDPVERIGRDTDLSNKILFSAHDLWLFHKNSRIKQKTRMPEEEAMRVYRLTVAF